MINRKKIIWIILGILIFFSITWFAYGKINYSRMVANCPDVQRSSFSLVDCRGILAVEVGDTSWSSKYVVRDTKHNYGVAGIYNLK